MTGPARARAVLRGSVATCLACPVGAATPAAADAQQSGDRLPRDAVVLTVNPAGGLSLGVDATLGYGRRVGASPGSGTARWRRRWGSQPADRWLEGYVRLRAATIGVGGTWLSYWGGLQWAVFHSCEDSAEPSSTMTGGFGVAPGVRLYFRSIGPTSGAYVGLAAELYSGTWRHRDTCEADDRTSWEHRGWWLAPALEVGHRWTVGERGHGLIGLGLVGGPRFLLASDFAPPASWNVDETEPRLAPFFVLVLDLGFAMY